MKIVDVRRLFFVMTMTLALWQVSCEHTSIQQPNPNPLVIQSHEIWRQADSPIILAVDVTVTAVGMLEIEPGTEIHFAEGSVVVADPAGDMHRSPIISVYGRLICKGTPGKIIKFVGPRLIFPGDPQISIRAENRQNADNGSLIEWTELGGVSWGGGAVTIRNSTLNFLTCEQNNSVEVTSNRIDYLIAHAKKGVISDNFCKSISLADDSITVANNTVEGMAGTFGAIRCSQNSRTLIINNTIRNSEVAFYIFSATPRIHRNNIVGNSLDMIVIPEWQKFENDTIYATDNYWGDTDSATIAGKIKFQSNGETISRKVVQFTPFARQPFGTQSKGSTIPCQ